MSTSTTNFRHAEISARFLDRTGHPLFAGLFFLAYGLADSN
jgi:hypothetical protein